MADRPLKTAGPPRAKAAFPNCRVLLVPFSSSRARPSGSVFRAILLRQDRVPELDLVAVDDVLNKAAAVDTWQSQILEFHPFGDLSIERTLAGFGSSREWFRSESV